MARTLEESPRFVTASEKEVYDKLVKQLNDDCLVIANRRVSDEHKDHEADILVLMPDSGVVVVEVKGSHVWHDGRNWRIERENCVEVIDPVEQARDASHALRRYVEADPRWGSRGRLRWSHHVVLARTRLDEKFSLPECPRWQISGQDELTTIGERVYDTTSLHKKDARVPDRAEVDLIAEILAGRFLPARDVLALAEDREERARRLTLEQAMLLQACRHIPRAEIRGAAGSGKTVMAMQQARDLATGRFGERKRVAVVCYSYGLAHYLKRELQVGSRAKRPAFVGTFEELGRSWGISEMGDRQNADFWEHELPARMADLALALPAEQRFDAIIVDEAQDFAEDWWTPLVRSLRNEESGLLYIYSDERQRVFPRFGRPPLPLVPLVLDHNLRNTRQIAKAFEPLAPPMEPRGGDGPAVTFVPCATGDEISTADDQVELLFEEGWEAKDIALITLGKRHPMQVERQEALGADGHWAEFWQNDDIFYGHVLGFKGLERRAVVLCCNESGKRDRAAERLYVGLSRATDRLVVVGDPVALERMGGPQVASRLGIRP